MIQTVVKRSGGNKVKVSIVIINWNTKQLLQQCLSSIYSHINEPSFEVLVVDNGSTDGSAGMVKSKFPQVRLIERDENLGFAKANNLAVSRCKGEYILLLNSDTVMLDSGIIDLVNFAWSHPMVGVIGGKVLNPDGSLQYSCRRLPNFWTYLIMHTTTLIKGFNDPISKRFTMVNFDHESPIEVGYVTGCYTLVPKRLIEQYGLFDESFFMFGEDAELCLRIRERGYHIYYVPLSPIIHFKGQSVKGNIAKGILVSFYSSRYFLEKVKGQWVGKFYGILVPEIWWVLYVFFALLKYAWKHPKIMKKYRLFKEITREYLINQVGN